MEKNRLQQELDALRARGAEVIDLIDTNFHRNGYRLPDELLLPLLEEYVRGRMYSPDPKGSRVARESVSAYYARSGIAISPENIILTASSSESYNLLFNNLASPGDNVVLPAPTYPLFEFLAEFNRLEVRFYRMDDRFRIDLESVAAVVDGRTRFLVVISPNNPTGQVAGETELRGLAEVAARVGASIISDEVFSEFLYPPYGGPSGARDPGSPRVAGRLPSNPTPPVAGGSGSADLGLPRPAAIAGGPPVYTLNGISKMFASPDLKLSWIAVSGEPAGIAEPVDRLEIANDVFLNCSSLAQFILPSLFSKGGEFTREMVADLARKRDLLMAAVGGGSRPLSVVPPEGGIHVPLRIASGSAAAVDDEEFSLALLRARGVYLHPGYFYGFAEADDSFLVVASFLLRSDRLAEGLDRLSSFLEHSG